MAKNAFANNKKKMVINQFSMQLKFAITKFYRF